MRALSTAELFDLWDQGRHRPPAEQALLLLDAACSEEPPDSLARLPVGRRDGRLLTLRELTFGPELPGMAVCPVCGQQLEYCCRVADLCSDAAPEAGAATVHRLYYGGFDVEFRLPNGQDLLAIAGSQEPAAGRLSLLERCLIGSRLHGRDVDPGELPDEVISAVVTAMAQADPQADVQLDLACPGCAHRWQAPFDIVSFFWAEIDTWARHVLRDVHALASAYGWREADVLALSPWRRRLYVQMSSG